MKLFVNTHTHINICTHTGPSIALSEKHETGCLKPTPQVPWMDTLTSQLEEPLGAAVTLAALLSASEELMKDYATPHFVDKVYLDVFFINIKIYIIISIYIYIYVLYDI